MSAVAGCGESSCHTGWFWVAEAQATEASKLSAAVDVLREGRRDEVWRKHGGFLDLSLQEFMRIQERLLMEQIDLLSKCELGNKLLGHRIPRSAEQFLQTTPLTT